jgi:hypothetical protein
MMFRAVFWVVLPFKMTIILHGSTTQKTALNIRIILLDFIHRLNYKIINLQRL